MGLYEIFQGDCSKALPYFESDSVDALVTDPPAGISFMGKDWDSDKGGRDQWIAWMRDVMKECLRVMKPGAHGLVWALPRTSHWTAMALEDAGFEVRDRVAHIFGSGFPKSLDVSKAIDKAAGAEREVVGFDESKLRPNRDKYLLAGQAGGGGKLKADNGATVTAPATDSAKQWAGWGTALKPAVEDWWLVRKPLSEKTVAANVLKWGTGALNIDVSRIGTEPPAPRNSPKTDIRGGGFHAGNGKTKVMSHYNPTQGRFPSHLVLDEDAALMLDEQSGVNDARGGKPKTRAPSEGATWQLPGGDPKIVRNNSGKASRFFYVAKTSSSERNAGLEGMPDKKTGFSDGARRAIERGETAYDTETGGGANRIKTTKNHHPTVKPQKLMRYLIQMITPPNGVVLDPFMGSGSTGVAAKSLGYNFIGIERHADYERITRARYYNQEIAKL